ncbi:ROK family protein, partial [Catenulispora subtropica]|uniref:ROK family protein n=1 Tax=Catenulispora subtropica TaxID=450798 RepID=UPI0031DA3A8C
AAGAGRGHDDMAAVVVSTGVGGGLILGGALYYGASGNAGHLGHAPVVVGGERCACGAAGCPEVYASGPNLVAWARRNGWDAPSPRPATADLAGRARANGRSLPWKHHPDADAPTPGDPLPRRPDAAAPAAAARAGDPVAVAAFGRGGRALGAMLAAAAASCDVTAIVVGGGVARAGDTLLDAVRSSFAEHAVLPFAASCQILPAALDADACLVGAAALIHRPDRYASARFHTGVPS